MCQVNLPVKTGFWVVWWSGPSPPHLGWGEELFIHHIHMTIVKELCSRPNWKLPPTKLSKLLTISHILRGFRYRWIVEEYISFKMSGILELLKKEGLGKKRKPNWRRECYRTNIQKELSNLTVHKDQREATTLPVARGRTIKITGGCNNHTSPQCWISNPYLLTLGAISLRWKSALAANCTCNYLLPGTISHLNLILSVQVFNFICEEVIPDRVSCGLSLCTCN